MVPWKYMRSVLKLGSRAKYFLLLLLLATVPFLLISLVRSKAHTHDRNDIERNNDDTGRSNKNSRLLLTAPSIQAQENLPPAPPVQEPNIKERFHERRQHLARACSAQTRYFQVQNSEAAVKEHLTIAQNYKLVYCAVEKVGCTFWKRVFQIMSGFRNVSDPFDIQGIRAYEGYLTAKGMPFDKIHMLLNAFTKFMFVREPFGRLLSGYVDKLFAPNPAYWEFVGKHITTNFRQNATDLSRTCGHDVTFEEFVRYFLQSQGSSEKRDAHFVPSFEHCRPCEIDYEYIGKLETFEEDTQYLLKQFKLDKIVKFYDFQSETEIDAIAEVVDYVFAMKGSISRCMTMPEAMLRAYRKLQIRGIISKTVPFPFSLHTTRDISPAEYRQALLSAHVQSGDPENRKSNRKEAFLEAYSTISAESLNKLKNELSVDTSLFGYDSLPKELLTLKKYHRRRSKNDFRFFKL